MSASPSQDAQPVTGFSGWIERAGKKIPDPVLIFMVLWPAAYVLAGWLGGYTFTAMGPGGKEVEQSIKPLFEAEHVRWVFDNALLANWLGFGNGVLAVILIVMMAVGIAENGGLLSALIKRLGHMIPERWLPLLLVFLGIMSSVATDAGYLILIPLAGLLYAALGKHPIIGMAAAFAGVSAGFSANLIPATAVDVIVGNNARAFAEAQGVPFTRADGTPLNAATMNYWFIAASTFLLGAVGAWVTKRFVERRFAGQAFTLPEGLDVTELKLSDEERRGLRAAGWSLPVAGLVVWGLIAGPLAGFTDKTGREVLPYLNNVILLIALFFAITGVAFGVAAGRFKNSMDVVLAMVASLNTMGYILVLTFFCYNFLALFAYSGLGALMTNIGAKALLGMGLQELPLVLLVGFVILTASVNLLIGGLTSKWMLLGPIFIPMLYAVNPAMTPDVVAAAYRVADSSTNIVTPMMAYAGIVLAFMRRFAPQFTLGDMILMMFPYALAFLFSWTGLLLVFFFFEIPFGF
jgi:aminobenzoyl-glutamate transport protein